MEEKFGICHLSVVPLRAEPADSSEMISQLLFGESFEVLEEQTKWVKIKCLWDEYEAWVDAKQVVLGISKNEANSTLRSNILIDKYADLELNHSNITLSIASTLSIDILQQHTVHKYRFTGRSAEMGSTAIEPISTTALKWMHTPYLWGGRSVFGIDCSGFSQNVLKMYGIKLKRDAYQQAEQGALVDFIEEAKPGDLAFFDNDEERIVHVGIILENNQIIHASGQVRIDRIDHQGIFNLDTKKYSHKLRIIKRFF